MKVVNGIAWNLNWNSIWYEIAFNSNSVQQDWIWLDIDEGVEILLVNMVFEKKKMLKMHNLRRHLLMPLYLGTD
jgi:hypothetical protein